MLFCFPLMAAIQEISARIGRVTGQGIAGNIRAHYPRWLLACDRRRCCWSANIINLGADLGAMGDGAGAADRRPARISMSSASRSAACCWRCSSRYERYVAILKWSQRSRCSPMSRSRWSCTCPGARSLYRTFVPNFSLQTGLRRRHRRGARHDHHALLLLLAILAGGRGRTDRSRRALVARSAGAGAGADQADAVRYLCRDGLFQPDQPVHHRHAPRRR